MTPNPAAVAHAAYNKAIGVPESWDEADDKDAWWAVVWALADLPSGVVVAYESPHKYRDAGPPTVEGLEPYPTRVADFSEAELVEAARRQLRSNLRGSDGNRHVRLDALAHALIDDPEQEDAMNLRPEVLQIMQEADFVIGANNEVIKDKHAPAGRQATLEEIERTPLYQAGQGPRPW